MTRQGNGYDTYYIYDDHGRLCYVLPPMAVDGMYNTGNYPDSHTLLQQYAYLYKYDDRGNCIGKRLPGCKSIQMIYDRANRLVMSQDGNQQSESLWTITKYDALSRVLYTYEANPLRSPGDLRQYCKENCLSRNVPIVILRGRVWVIPSGFCCLPPMITGCSRSIITTTILFVHRGDGSFAACLSE